MAGGLAQEFFGIIGKMALAIRQDQRGLAWGGFKFGDAATQWCRNQDAILLLPVRPAQAAVGGLGLFAGSFCAQGKAGFQCKVRNRLTRRGRLSRCGCAGGKQCEGKGGKKFQGSSFLAAALSAG